MTTLPFPPIRQRPPAGRCSECGEVHAPESAHLAQTALYREGFARRSGRPPTWRDAIEHCPEPLRREWEECLADLGVDLGAPA